jgi:hypothetical protein
MLNVMHDCEKRRLIEREDILTAVSILKSQGCRTEDLIHEMTKVFYVDLDEFNQLVKPVS